MQGKVKVRDVKPNGSSFTVYEDEAGKEVVRIVFSDGEAVTVVCDGDLLTDIVFEREKN